MRHRLREGAFWLYHRHVRRTNLRELRELFRQSERWDLERLRVFQTEGLRALLSHCAANVPYYADLFREYGLDAERVREPEDLRRLPFLTKEIIGRQFERLLSRDVDATRLKLNSTSGSTGSSLLFYSDRASRVSQALQLRADEWLGLQLFDRELRIWGAHWDVSALRQALPAAQNFLLGRQIVSGYRLSDEGVADCLERIRRFRPRLLHSYPSILYLLASRWQGAPPRGLEAIRSAGEKLFDFQRARIEERFGCKIFDFYGARDIPIVAQECEAHAGLHVNMEHVVLEVVDDSGSPIEEGEGELVLTHLANRIMPFVRYRIGDRAHTRASPCPCGRALPLLLEVTGRTFDVLLLPNGNRVGGTFWTLLMRSGASEELVKSFQVVQRSRTRIAVIYVAREALPEGEEWRLRGLVLEHGGPELELTFERADEITPTKGGKWRFVVDEWGGAGEGR